MDQPARLPLVVVNESDRRVLIGMMIQDFTDEMLAAISCAVDQDRPCIRAGLCTADDGEPEQSEREATSCDKSQKQERVQKEDASGWAARPVHQEHRDCAYDARREYRSEYSEQVIYSDVSPESPIDASDKQGAHVDNDYDR